ncbi:MAG TPA: sulfite exporter TauE/SafE family protein [Chitinispirillaceae bacterium]|nr:sulfite exporter TauE/SafE family protein [Chitinispirillaceae bacterium]
MIMFSLFLFIIGWIAATVSGIAGFGGALLLLPILSNTIDVKSAIPVLTIGQLFGNVSRAWFGRKEIKWIPVAFFISTAIPFSVTGSFFLNILSKRIIFIVIGILLIVFVALRRFRITQFNWGNKGLLFGGALTGFLSGIAGSAGPIGAAFFLGLNLSATAYISSEATTAVVMHITKSIAYERFALIGQKEIYLGIVLGAGMVSGSWTGKKIIERLPKNTFIIIVEILLFLSGLQLIFLK